MSSSVNVVPQRAVLAEEINGEDDKLNTILAVKAGEVIPIDGVVVEGTCEVDEKFLTGESFPVAEEKDSIVWASTINLNGYVTVKTTAVAEDSVVARMAKLVEDAQHKKSSILKLLLYELNISGNISRNSSIESKSSHPMAAALVDFARVQGIEPKPEEVENFQIFPGEGICERIEDNDAYVGNWKVGSRAGCTAGEGL
ncbi:Cadmium/zinc-transporting ATPase HMA2 [Sesamum alatum]|uniref:Cadmium/zinc-transporting ATPase HMA2 n=1 Tax=Sesamum alatum TaxID=300844 RepID=A0AAE2CAE9_9LAMI|nr:Cadmium/zinc-transporting ATPase HMA2 [Sesamum alatum]